MSTFELGGHTYSIGRMPARTQHYLIRRLSPFTAFLGILQDGRPIRGRVPELLGTITKAFNEMSDADQDFILDSCFSVVKRRQGEAGFADIAVTGSKELMFSDIDVFDQYVIVIHVVQDSLGPFVGAAGRFLENLAPPTDQTTSQ